MSEEKRFCFCCAEFTLQKNVSANDASYYYCAKCFNGLTGEYPELAYLNQTTTTYKNVMDKFLKGYGK